MCRGGPNHCRVGRAGSQSFYGRLIVVYCLQQLVVRLMSPCCVHHCCILLVIGWRRRVECVCSLVHARTHTLKKIVVVKREVCYKK
jgi:hypothetical protein